IDRAPRFGPGFARPTKRALRLERAKNGPRVFEAAELRKMIEAAGQPLKAMLLLGANWPLRNADVGQRPLLAPRLARGWLNFTRVKTGQARRAALWPETVAAVRDALEARPAAKDPADDGLVFLTAKGNPWHKKIEDNPVSKETRKLLDALGINGHR